MATVIFATLGASIGGSLLGPAIGATIGAGIGRAIGATIGQKIDEKIFAQDDMSKTEVVKKLRMTSMGEGEPIPVSFGRYRIGGHIIWSDQVKISQNEDGDEVATLSFALALTSNEIKRIERVWLSGQSYDLTRSFYRLHKGKMDQQADHLIMAREGEENTPRYQGLSYIVFEDFDLSESMGQLPQFEFEVVSGTPLCADNDPFQQINSVHIIPATGEYSLDTKIVRETMSDGQEKRLNAARGDLKSDFVHSMDALVSDFPNISSAPLVIAWFGNDLRAESCQIIPKVETRNRNVNETWYVGNDERDTASVVVEDENGHKMGGAPSDGSVLRALEHLKEKGLKTEIYPFILMDIPSNNELPDPYSGNIGQASYPWRGRITANRVGSDINSSYGQAAIHEEINSFVGNARLEDFEIIGQRVKFTGDDYGSYRHFILHYAHLAKIAGGVDSFYIGSEMIGLTSMRDHQNQFPFVDALIELARDVRQLLGASTKISYAADWSEYRGHQDMKNGANFFFNLDPLWSSNDISFVGIDNYMPVSDWRDKEGHADMSWQSIYNIDYLQNQIENGEGKDWYYKNEEDQRLQIRTEISDWYGEHFIWQYKNIRDWWRLPHFNRPNGEPAERTLWEPESKPIRFSEYGTASVDKSTNAPNKFLDNNSSESGLAPYSTGEVDRFLQTQFLQAFTHYWKDKSNNPISSIYDNTMVDIINSSAWVYDARPWPDFPLREDLWSDAVNFSTGHWLNANAACPLISNVIASILLAAGWHNFDVSRVYGLLDGVAYMGAESAVDRLNLIMQIYDIRSFYKDNTLYFVTNGYDKIKHIDDAEYIRQSNDNIWEYTRDECLNNTSSLEFNYPSLALNFENRTQYLRGEELAKLRLDTSVALSDDTAKEITQWIYSNQKKVAELNVILSRYAHSIDIGDVVSMNSFGFKEKFVVTEKLLGDSTQIKLRALSSPLAIKSKGDYGSVDSFIDFEQVPFGKMIGDNTLNNYELFLKSTPSLTYQIFLQNSTNNSLISLGTKMADTQVLKVMSIIDTQVTVSWSNADHLQQNVLTQSNDYKFMAIINEEPQLLNVDNVQQTDTGFSFDLLENADIQINDLIYWQRNTEISLSNFTQELADGYDRIVISNIYGDQLMYFDLA